MQTARPIIPQPPRNGRTNPEGDLHSPGARGDRGQRACSKKMDQRFLLTAKTVRNDVHTKPQKMVCRGENAMKRQPSGILDGRVNCQRSRFCRRMAMEPENRSTGISRCSDVEQPPAEREDSRICTRKCRL